MKLNTNSLQLNIILQDAMREKLASLGVNEVINGSNVILGDSDIDYNLIANGTQPQILSSPYGNINIKSPLNWNGTDELLVGNIVCFARKVIDDGNGNGIVQGLYDYNINETWITNYSIPTLANGKPQNAF